MKESARYVGTGKEPLELGIYIWERGKTPKENREKDPFSREGGKRTTRLEKKKVEVACLEVLVNFVKNSIRKRI